MKRASFITLAIIGAYSALQAAWAVDYPLPPEGSRLIGQNQTYTVQEGDKTCRLSPGVLIRRRCSFLKRTIRLRRCLSPVR